MFLRKDGSVSIHDENIKEAAFENLKFEKRVSPSSSEDIFMQLFENHCNLRNKSSVRRSPIKNVFHGTEISSNLSPIKLPLGHRT